MIGNGAIKTACIILSFLLITCRICTANQLLCDDKTINTPVGRFGIWKLTALDPSSTNHDYWILAGRLGKWHIKGSGDQAPPRLLPVLVVTCMLGAVAVVGMRRKSASTAPVE